MKTSILLFVLCFLNVEILSGQQLFKRTEKAGENSDMYITTIKFHPGNNNDGFIGSFEVVYAFRNCFGDIVLDYQQKGLMNFEYYRFKGRNYRISEIPDNLIPKQRSGFAFYADVYDKELKVGTLVFDESYLGHGIAVGCFGNGITSFEKLGVKYSKHRDKWWSRLNLKNFSFNADATYGLREYNIEYYLKKQLENEEYDAVVNKARSAEQRGDLESALELYREARNITAEKDNDNSSENISRLEKLLREQEKREQIERLEQEAEELEILGDLESAVAKYREIQYIDPDNEIAENRISDIKNKIDLRNDLFEKAEEAEQTGEDETAISYYKAILDIDPNNRLALQKIEELEEKLRIERLEVWREEKRTNQAVQEEKNKEIFAAQAASISLLSVLMFQGMGKDSYNNHYDPWGMNTKIRYGYGFTSIPVFEKKTTEFYDGNNSRFTEELRDANINVATINAGIEFWPLRTSIFDIGVSGGGNFGIGLNSHVAYEIDLGGEINVGTNYLKAVGLYTWGIRGGNYYYELFDEYGGNFNSSFYGGTDIKFINISGGLKYLFNSWNTRAEIELLYHLQNPDSPAYHIGHGFSLSYSAFNRLKITGEFFWDYPRTYDESIDYSEYNGIESSYSGLMFSIKLIRLIDFYNY